MVAPEPGAAGDARRGLGMPAPNQYSTLDIVKSVPVLLELTSPTLVDVSVQVTKYEMCQILVHANLRGHCWYSL